jgi:hypothetical protein
MSISISMSIRFRDLGDGEGERERHFVKNVASKFNHDFPIENPWLVFERKGEAEEEEEGQ